MLSEEQIAQATALFVTASSVSRYQHCAIELADGQLARTGETVAKALQRARSLWQEVRGAKERTASEFELAVLLAYLRVCPAAESLLTEIAASSSLGAFWVAALAREFLGARRVPSTNAFFQAALGVAAGVAASVGVVSALTGAVTIVATMNKQVRVRGNWDAQQEQADFSTGTSDREKDVLVSGSAQSLPFTMGA